MNSYLRALLQKYTVLVLTLSVLFFNACSPKLYHSNTEPKLYPIRASDARDSSITKFLGPYKVSMDSQMNEVIVHSALEITKAKPEGLLNNLIADAMADIARQNGIQFDIVFNNYGGIRISLPKGDIRLYKLFELMPFENILTTVEFSGSDLRDMFDYMALNGGDPISGASFRIRDKKAEYIRIVGKTIDPEKTYIVLTSDYMANGGDQAVFFKKSINRREFPIKIRDAIINYLKAINNKGEVLNPKKDGRITVE